MMIFTDDHDRRFYLANNLLENAKSSIMNVAQGLSGERNIRWIDEHKLKNHLSSVQNALECLLKVPLAWKDWHSVVIDSHSVDRSAFDAGQFKTITYDESVKLLKKAPFLISLSRLKSKPLYELRMSRHQHTHYHLSLSNERCLELIAHGIDFCLEFYKDNIFKQFYEEKDAFSELNLLMKCVDVYVSVRILTMQKRFGDALVPLTGYFDYCSRCDQTAPIINSPDTVLCLYCGKEDDINYIAEHVAYRPYPGISETKPCPECLYHSMGTLHSVGDPESWQCVICGYYTNKPSNLNGRPGGLHKKHMGKPERRQKLRWPQAT